MKNTKELYLVLKNKYFLEILKGEKKEEYRDFTEYYISRLCNVDKDGELLSPKTFESVRFQLGYSQNAPQMVVGFEGVSIDADDDGTDVYTYENCNFIIHLGEIKEKINCDKYD